jgi:hypothetical protein
MLTIGESAKITSQTDANNWSGVFSEDGLFLSLEITTSDSDAQKFGKKIFEEIIDLLREASVEESLLPQIVLKMSHYDEIVSAVFGLVGKDKLYIGGIREGAAYMYRDGRAGQILDGEEYAVGSIRDNDRILILGKRLHDKIGPDNLIEFLKEDNFDDAYSLIVSRLSQDDEIKGAAALFFAVEDKVIDKDINDQDLTSSQKKKNIFLNTVLLKIKNITSFSRFSNLKQRILILAAILVVLILSINIFSGIKQNSLNEKSKRLDETVNIVNHQYKEALNLIDLNPQRARALLSDSKLSLSPFLSEFAKNSREYKKISELLGKISESETIAYKIYKITQAPIFFDIGLIKPEGEGVKIASFRKQKAILDTKNKVVYALETTTKKTGIIAGSEIVKDAQNIAVYDTSAYIVNSDGIYEIDLEDKEIELVVKKDDEWGNIADIATFAGNVYLLDKGNNMIWKYIKTDFGLSDRTRYLNTGAGLDISDSVGMTIDGSVWVYNSSDILKFTQGNYTNFIFQGFSESFHNIASVSTSDIDKYLYILDKDMARVVVFDKDGLYLSQYQWEGLQDATDIVVSEDEDKLFVLVQSKIYAFDLKD